MTGWRKWLSAHKFEVHALAFLMMVFSPVPLYLAARQGAGTWIWVFLAPVVLANMLVLLVR